MVKCYNKQTRKGFIIEFDDRVDYKFFCLNTTTVVCRAHCCYLPVRISYKERKRIEEYSGLKFDKFCTPSVELGLLNEVPEIEKGIDYMLKHTSEGRCIFLKNGRCSIYEARPLSCKVYPFQIVRLGDNRVYVGLSDSNCPGLGKGNSVKEELERYVLELVNI